MFPGFHDPERGSLRPALTNWPQSLKIVEVLPKSGPVAQLGARFHGMEEVIGSIPIRSTNYFNNLAEPPPRAWQQIGSKSQFAICRRSASFLPTPF